MVKMDILRTLFITQRFDPEPGFMHGLPLAKWLQMRKHAVKVVTGFPNYPIGKIYPGYHMQLCQHEDMGGVSVFRVPLYASHDKSAIRRFASYTSFATTATTIGLPLVREADVAYVYHPAPTVGMPAMVFKTLCSVPFVYHIADMWPDTVLSSDMLAAGLTRQVVEGLLSSWCNLVYQQASSITVLSPGFKRMLVERGVPAEKIHVIYNWADDTVFQPVPRDPALAEKLGFHGRFNVVYAGNLGNFQGLDTVIRAAARLKEFPEIQIVLIGTGLAEHSLQTLAQELEAHNILFMEHQPYREMPKINSLADVLLIHLKDLPFFSSTIPGKTQAALASGRPILMAVRGDASDLVQKAGAGLTSTPQDDAEMAHTILQFYHMERDQREAMGASGRAFYERELSLDIAANRLDSLLREVSQRNKSKR